MSEQISTVFSDVGEGSSSDMLSFSDTVFGFLDENYPLSENSSLDEKEWGEEVEDEDDEENCDSFNERKAFWDEQEKLLQGILYRTSSIETKVRNATKDAFQELKGTSKCCCQKSVAGEGCKECLRRDISDRLCNAGISCSLRKSKWRHSSEIPAGEHIYLEVVEKTNKGEVRIVIELNFRAEFEMAKASQEYNRLVQWLPEVYVGKEDRLRNAIKILCGAAKRCTKERKVHLGPWRKLKYMQAKWLSPYTELILTVAKETVVVRKANAAMFSLPLLGKLPGSNFQPVAVV